MEGPVTDKLPDGLLNTVDVRLPEHASAVLRLTRKPAAGQPVAGLLHSTMT